MESMDQIWDEGGRTDRPGRDEEREQPVKEDGEVKTEGRKKD